MKNVRHFSQLIAGILLIVCSSLGYKITAQTTSESEIPAEIQERVDKAIDRLSQVASLSGEQRSRIEPLMLEMLLQARVIIQDTTTPLETRQDQIATLLETTRLHIEPLLTQSQQEGFDMVWNRVSEGVMGKLE
jgi:hypothetical protein